MAFRIRQIDTTADGREIVRERTIDKPSLTLGRAAENDLHLPDLGLDPQHATIANNGDGRIAVDSSGTLGFTQDGAMRQNAVIACRNGGELGFGSYRITVSLDETTPVLTLRELADSADHGDDAAGFTLASVLPGRRRMGWIAVLLILGLFLALPIASHMLRGSSPGDKVIGDANWSTGKLSRAHHQLEGKCETCHVQGFVAVNDQTCRTCHKDSHDHADANRLALARGHPGLGAAALDKVSALFNRPGPGACIDCHIEHDGPAAMAAPQQKFCADCHAGLKQQLPDTRLGNAADFGTAHPQFAPRIVTNADSRTLRRVSLDTKPREDSGLTFPHKLHLDTMGGAARMAVSLGTPAGYGKPLTCANCHRPGENGVRFKPIEMERDCAACHSLAYDRIGGTVRKLHHGDVAQTLADLSTYSGAVPLTGRQKPGVFGPGGPYQAQFASAPPVSMAAFGKQGVCGTCHTAEMRGGKLAVRPVTLPQRYMDHGWFSHAAHRQSKCSDCHAAGQSTSAADLLLPDLASCRTCHLGEDSKAKDRVPSTCALCHSYHPPDALTRQRGRAEINRQGG